MAGIRDRVLRCLALFAFIALAGVSCVAQTAAVKRSLPRVESFETTQAALPDGWQVVSGKWGVSSGALVADSLSSEAYLTFGSESWQDYEVQARVTFRKVRNPSRWLSIVVRAVRDGRTPWSQVAVRFDATQPNGMEFAVRTPANDWSVRTKAAAATPARRNQARHLKVIVRGSQVDGFLDGEPVINSHFCVDRATGCVGLGVSGCVAVFDDVSVRQLPVSISASVSSADPCEIVAHRGYSAVAPENTLAAIRAAVKAGATGCEFDVYGCRDGTVVLMHDKTVDRTTDGTGLVTDLSLPQLRLLDAGSWKHSRYKGERVPTLVEALTLLKGTNCQPVIEIKMEGISQRVIDDVRSLGMVDQVAIIAFSDQVVREIRTLEPRIKCAWLYGESLKGTVAEQADWLTARARSCNVEVLDLNYRMLSPKLIAELKRRSFSIWTWTVNEAVVMQALQRWGVDSITTDRLNLLP